jgi:hypothetical protein
MPGGTCEDGDKDDLGDGEGHAAGVYRDASPEKHQGKNRCHEHPAGRRERCQDDAERRLLRVRQKGGVV